MSNPQYDNLNRGVMFKPRDNQKIVGAGRINIDGRDSNMVVVMEPLSRDGNPEWVVYAKIGVLFNNDNKQSENSPDRSGPVDGRPDKRLAAWRKEKDGRPFFSISVGDKQAGGGQGSAPAGDGWDSNVASPPASPPTPPGASYDIDDEIPF